MASETVSRTDDGWLDAPAGKLISEASIEIEFSASRVAELRFEDNLNQNEDWLIRGMLTRMRDLAAAIGALVVEPEAPEVLERCRAVILGVDLARGRTV